MGKIISRIRSRRGKEKLKSAPPKLWDIEVTTLKGTKKKLREFKKGKKLFLFVNIASSCCLTSANYRQLNALYKDLEGLGLEILAFPCFQFGGSESYCKADIEEMMREKFKTKFQTFQKIEVNGESSHPVYRYLRQKSELFCAEDEKAKVIPWNFAKFLVDREGNVVQYYDPYTFPKKFHQELRSKLLKMYDR